MWTIFKVFIDFVTISLCFGFWPTEFVTILLPFPVSLFWPWDMWHLSSGPGIQPAPRASKGEALATGPPGKSLTENSENCVVSVLNRASQGFTNTARESVELTEGIWGKISVNDYQNQLRGLPGAVSRQRSSFSSVLGHRSFMSQGRKLPPQETIPG